MITNPVAPILNNAAGLGVFIGNLIGMGIIIASIMVLLYLVLGGIEWISSQGDKAGLEQARNRITNALLGLAIVVASWALMTIISTFLGLSFPCLPIPTLDGKPSTCAGAPGPSGTSKPGDVGADCSKPESQGGGDAACKSRVCSLGKCAAGCSGFGDSEC